MKTKDVTGSGKICDECDEAATVMFEEWVFANYYCAAHANEDEWLRLLHEDES